MKKAILLVEDEKVVSTYLSSYFRRSGYDVDIAANGADALKTAQARNYDLVLLDLLLPDMDGVDVLEELKKQSPNTAVIIVTGVTAEPEILAECTRKGAFGFVHKDATVDHLLMHVRRAIGE
jgi:DNA-binding response OmpR family regulator